VSESNLRILLANLESSRSSLHWWLEFWTALVVLGVVLEVIFVVWEYVEDLRDFGRGIIHPPERPSLWLLVFGLLAVALVAVGVAGELYEDSKIESVETEIGRANDELYLLLSKEAGDAAQSAKGAAKGASEANASADALKRYLAQLATPRDIVTSDRSMATMKSERPDLPKSKSILERLPFSNGFQNLSQTCTRCILHMH